MKVKFRKTETGKEHTVRQDMDQFYLLDSVPSNWSSDCLVAVRKSAVDVVKDEPTYSIGQHFYIGLSGNEYILAQVGPSMIAFIALADGNRFKEATKVGNVAKVTTKELDQIGWDYSLVIR